MVSSGSRGEDAFDVPVAGGAERHPGPLALDQDAGGDALHPAGGQLRHDLLPQHRGDLVAVEPVEDAAGLLGVDKPLVDLARVVDRRPDRLRGDLVEDHPPDRDARLEGLQQVPGDGLALAVLIRREVELAGVLQQRLELGDLRLLVRGDDVERLETVVDIDAEAGPRLALDGGRDVCGVARQVADVADAGLDEVAVAEVAGDRAGLRRRLHDDQAQPRRQRRQRRLVGVVLARGGTASSILRSVTVVADTCGWQTAGPETEVSGPSAASMYGCR